MARPVGLATPGGRVRLAQQGARSVLSGTVGGQRFSVMLPAEDGIFPGSLYDARLVGTRSGTVLILLVDYLSRPGNPTAACGAGMEAVLRIIALRPQPRQTFSQRVDSCWNTIESGKTEWNAGASTVTVERWAFSDPASHTRATFHVGADGTVVPGTVTQLPENK